MLNLHNKHVGEKSAGLDLSANEESKEKPKTSKSPFRSSGQQDIQTKEEIEEDIV